MKRVCVDGPVFDADGCLACGGLVETHIHLDKSDIIDRCAPEDGRQANSMQRVAAVKPTFTVEDVYARAGRTLEKCIKQGATRMRTEVLSTSVFLELSIGNLYAAIAVSILMVIVAVAVLALFSAAGQSREQGQTSFRAQLAAAEERHKRAVERSYQDGQGRRPRESC